MNTEQLKKLEKSLWAAADNLRANSDLKSNEYATPVLGLIFLKFADNKYSKVENEIVAEHAKLKGSRREKPLSEVAIEKCGFYLPEHARYDYLLNCPEEEDMAKAIKRAMELVEEHKKELDGILPKDEYFALTRTDRTLPAQLLKTFSDIPRDATGDILGKIYEFFLGKFALAEGQGGGVFYTPTSVVRLMVEVIEPYKGTVYDPACGSAGMFVQSQQFIEDHNEELELLGEKHDENKLFVYGQEKTLDTVKLAKMNIAVNGLRGEIQQANSYKENPFDSYQKFDYVLANPPFNVDDVPVADVEDDIRFNEYGIPKKKTKAKKKDEGKETVPNGNYLWINLFATSLKEKGRAALVMANSASDARHSEADIRKTLIENNLIYGMLTLPSNMFYTVTLPATLWFFDKDKQDDNILFIDARNVFTQIDRAHREFSPEQISNLAIISKLQKGRRREFVHLIDTYFEKGMDLLVENKKQVEPVSEQLLEVLDDEQGKVAVGDLVKQWKELNRLQKKYSEYQSSVIGKFSNEEQVDTINSAQHSLQKNFDPFFEALHQGLKQLDKIIRKKEKIKADKAKAQGKRVTTDRQTKQLKTAIKQLHAEVKSAENYFSHVSWLHDRFPNVHYENVTGLCKLATLEEVEEQDYSLNPARYVGIIIEEDGKSQEDFIEFIYQKNESLKSMTESANSLINSIDSNLTSILED
tara:strand:+ start:5986 stop:8079 length:2094 start_codon:yes stop_codon:yes gene_type:complete